MRNLDYEHREETPANEEAPAKPKCPPVRCASCGRDVDPRGMRLHRPACERRRAETHAAPAAPLPATPRARAHPPHWDDETGAAVVMKHGQPKPVGPAAARWNVGDVVFVRPERHDCGGIGTVIASPARDGHVEVALLQTTHYGIRFRSEDVDAARVDAANTVDRARVLAAKTEIRNVAEHLAAERFDPKGGHP